ncbi:MAG: sigma factor-like helix-turn-helix DNA-binding protein [Patescibacteria group bacterium]
MAILSFKPKQITKKFAVVLPERAYDVLSSRFGLGDNTERQTLESIGRKYGITRERVRQIENFSLQSIKKSDAFKKEKSVFDELHGIIDSLGAVISENELLQYLSSDESARNHLYFFLVLGEPFAREKEDEHFTHRWHINEKLAGAVYEALRNVYANLGEDELVQESEILESFLSNLKDVSEKYKNEEIVRRWLKISKRLGQNQFGDWGRSDSSNIRARGMRDYAYLVIRKHGSPLHFREVANSISEAFGRKAHVATTHNELIKDPRFILVGRGLYALAEWGYTKGVVRDVIREILKREGSMSREDIAEKVMKERYVKENTVMVNLQNGKHFKKTKDGLYALA